MGGYQDRTPDQEVEASAAGTPSVALSAERVERLVEVLSLVAVGEHQAALDTLPAAEDGVLLETCVRVLVTELAASQATNTHYLGELEESGRQLAERLTLIERQREALAALSTPIIEVWDSTLALPIIGAVDAARALVMGERLLQRVVELRARNVILDLTGMEAIDAATVGNLTQMARGVQLLGAGCIITGVSPMLAQTLVDLNLDLRPFRTQRTLKDGLAESLGRVRTAT
jgi:rsbT co-antagonist protein RsbR